MDIKKLFTQKRDNVMVPVNAPEQIVVPVPDIKEYLVREYERVAAMRARIEGLEQELDAANELKFKYDALLVTLDEYSKRLEQAEGKIAVKQGAVDSARRETARARDELNNYKIKLTEATLTKEEIKDEIERETKEELVAKIKSHKGRLSKEIVCKIIEGEEDEQ